MVKNRYVDIPCILQVLGGIYQNPDLLDNERYNIIQEDLTEELHKVIFGSIYNLHNLGAKKIDPITIEQYLEQRPKKLAVYKTNGGAEYLEKLNESTQIAAFDYYYKRMKKFTLLRMYDSIGVDCSSLYDPDNILDIKKKQKQEDWLDNTSIDRIADAVDAKIELIKAKYVEEADDTFAQAGDGADDLIEHLMQCPEIGYPLYGDLNNSIHRGARLGKLYLRSAPSGVGKALPNSTVIPTPNGEKTVGQIRPGDYLFDAFGRPTLVKAIYPQGQKEVWEITFKDGRKAKCCEEHLWSYCTSGQRKKSKEERSFKTSTLKELSQMALMKDGGYNLLVPMQKAAEYPTKNFIIKPYSFGLMLGDGSFRYSNNNKAFSYSSENSELPEAIAEEMNWNYKKNSDKNYSWTFEWKESKDHKNVWVEEILKDYPELLNIKSEDKFIPKEYLEGDIEQRYDLLNGLLDSDGTVDKEKGRVNFYTVSLHLKEDVIKLANGLGFKATWLIDNHKESLPLYKVEISGNPEDKAKLFKLKRKHDLMMKWVNNGKRKENNLFNPIIEIKKLDYSEEMTCFYVDNEEHLFLMNDFIVTHNTRAMIADACTIGCGELFKNGQWVENKAPESVVYITTEQQLDEIQTMMLAFIADVDEDHILNNGYLPGELDRVRHAAAVLIDSKIHIKRLSDFSLTDIENTIKFSVREFDCKYIFHDYIHSSMKILSEVSGKAGVKGLREDNVLFMIAVRLKDLCVEYGIFIETSTQLNGDFKDAKIYDQNLLRGAKAIADWTKF